MDLLACVKRLENEGNTERRAEVVRSLRAMGIEPGVQRCALFHVSNLVIDFGHPQSATTIFSAHYDRVSDSPGANDNASGVAVLLGLCQRLKERSGRVRVIFFDREEAWLRMPFVRLGLLGSLCYVARKSNLQTVSRVINLEACGNGDAVVAWPVKEDSPKRGTVLEDVRRVSSRLGLQVFPLNIPWFLMSSDHLPFRLRGLRNALTLSLMPAAEMRAFLGQKVSVGGVLGRRRRSMPYPLSLVHTTGDNSGSLSEESLQLMLRMVVVLNGLGEPDLTASSDLSPQS